MTKLKGNARRMLQMFKEAKFKLEAENEELERCAEYRDAT